MERGGGVLSFGSADGKWGCLPANWGGPANLFFFFLCSLLCVVQCLCCVPPPHDTRRGACCGDAVWRHGGGANGGERGRRSSRGGGLYRSHPQWRTVRGAARPPRPPSEHQAVDGAPGGGGRERPPPPLAALQRSGQLWPARASGPPPPRRPTPRPPPPAPPGDATPAGRGRSRRGRRGRRTVQNPRTGPADGLSQRLQPVSATAVAARARGGAREGPPPRGTDGDGGWGGGGTGGTPARSVYTVPLCLLRRLDSLSWCFTGRLHGDASRTRRGDPLPNTSGRHPPGGGPPARGVTHTAS